jgi:membrane protease YdiL (CAAX protease family)
MTLRTRAHILVLTALTSGFVASVCLRVIVGRPDVSHSAAAGLLFAGCLALLALVGGARLSINRKVIIYGLLGSAFLCLPAIIMRIVSGNSHIPEGSYLVWSLIVSIVAIAEEAFLRGAYYDAVARFSNQGIAIILAAIAFASLHLPLYGWHAVPLDFAVGLWLGALRYTAGSFVAPGIAHVLADLVAWWL